MRHFLLEKQHENFEAVGEKMSHQDVNERYLKIGEKDVRHFLHKTCN